MENQKTANYSCPNGIDPVEMVLIREASSRTGLSYDCLRKLCLANKIVHIRAGTKYYINFGRLVEYLNAPNGQATND